MIEKVFENNDKSTWPPDDEYIEVKKPRWDDFNGGITIVTDKGVRMNDYSSDFIDDREDWSCDLEDGDIWNWEDI